MIGMPSAFALGIFSGKFILFCVSEKPAGFSETLFHRRVAVGNCIKNHCTSILCNGSLFFTPFYCAL